MDRLVSCQRCSPFVHRCGDVDIVIDAIVHKTRGLAAATLPGRNVFAGSNVSVRCATKLWPMERNHAVTSQSLQANRGCSEIVFCRGSSVLSGGFQCFAAFSR